MPELIERLEDELFKQAMKPLFVIVSSPNKERDYLEMLAANNVTASSSSHNLGIEDYEG